MMDCLIPEILPPNAELNGLSNKGIWPGRSVYNEIKDTNKDNVCLTKGCVWAGKKQCFVCTGASIL